MYADGEYLVNITACGKTVKAAVQKSTKVLAIKVLNNFEHIGFMAVTSSGIVSDTDWKCTSASPPSQWNTVDFDDSEWPQAVGYTNHGNVITGTTGNKGYCLNTNDFPQNAHLLATSNRNDYRMFCRRVLQ